MRELPVDAKAFCTDGEVGWVTDVVVDQAARAISHIVVREDSMASREFLVPLDKVVESSREKVTLGCTKAELATYPEFTTTHYVPASSPEAQPVVAAWQMEAMSYSYGYEPIYVPSVAPDEMVPIDEHHVEAGHLAFERGSQIESSDEQLAGEVAAFLLSPEDGKINHFVMRVYSDGPAREVILPLSSVNYATPGAVRLKLTKAQLDQLPAVPPGSKYSPADTNPDALHLISVVFDQPDQAEAALKLARSAEPKLDAATVRKNADGKITSKEAHDISTKKGAVAGAVIGGVLTVVGGPLGLVAASAIGGGTGAVVGHVVDRGVPDRYVRDLGRALRAGSSALVMLVPQKSEATVLEQLEPLHGNVLRLELTDEMVTRLTEAG